MRWFRIKRAKIDPEFRKWFEERGVDTVRVYVGVPGFTIPRPEGRALTERELRPPMLMWLKEQYDRAERKETWLITMEVAITLLVFGELVMSILDFASRHSK